MVNEVLALWTKDKMRRIVSSCGRAGSPCAGPGLRQVWPAMASYDLRPPAREPALNLPAVIVWLLAVLVLIQLVRGFLSEQGDYLVISWLAFVPARLTLWLEPGRLDDVVGALAQSAAGQDVGDRLQLVQIGRAHV